MASSAVRFTGECVCHLLSKAAILGPTCHAAEGLFGCRGVHSRLAHIRGSERFVAGNPVPHDVFRVGVPLHHEVMLVKQILKLFVGICTNNERDP